MPTAPQPFPTPAPPSPPRNRGTGFDDDRNSSGDSPSLTNRSPSPERREDEHADSNHEKNTSPLPSQSPPPSPSYPSPPPPPGAYGSDSRHRPRGYVYEKNTSTLPSQSPPPSPSYPSPPPPPGAYGSDSRHRPRGYVYDIENFDSLGNMRLPRHHRPRSSRSRRRHRRSRHRPEFSDFPEAFPPPPPIDPYHPVSGYQGSGYPPPMPPYAQNDSYSPYATHVPQYHYQYPLSQPYQSPVPPYEYPMPPYQSPIPPPYPSSKYPPPSPSSIQHPPLGSHHFDHRHFRTVQHRFAGWIFEIRTDAAPRSKKLKVKRVGDSIEYYCSGVLLTKIKYKLQGDIFHLYEDSSADRSALPYTDPGLCSKIEILMACTVADLFEPPWDMNDLDITWGVSECHDIGNGNSLLVSVNKDTSGGTAMLDSLSRRSSVADGSESPRRLERRSSGPLVSQLDAFQRIGSYDRARGFHSHRGANIFDRSQVVSVLRHVELITARQLAKQSYLQSSEVASVIGTKDHVFASDHVQGKFDATVPTLFGLLVSKLQAWRRRQIPSDDDYTPYRTASDDSDSTISYPSSSGHKATDNSDSESPEIVIPGGAMNSTHGYNDYPSGMEPPVGTAGNSDDESQESGDDPFSQQDRSDADTENSVENVLHLPSNDGPSKNYPKQGKELWLPGTPPENQKIKHDYGFATSDNQVVPPSITSVPWADPSYGGQDVAPFVDKDALPPLPGHTNENAVKNDLKDNAASPAQGETLSSRIGMKVVQSQDETLEMRASTHTDLTQPSEQGSSVVAAIKHQDLDGQHPLEELRTENLNEQRGSDNTSSDEGQTQGTSPSNSLDNLKLSEKDNVVHLSGSADEREDFDGSDAFTQPDRETRSRQSNSSDTSSNEGRPEEKEARDEGQELKPILRLPGERPRRNGTSHRVKFRLPSPEHTTTDEEVWQNERHEEIRNEWNERRSDHERSSYPPSPHATGHQYPSPPSMASPPGMDYYGYSAALEYPSEDSAYKEAVNAGQVYERPFEASYQYDAPRRRSSKDSNMGSTYSIDLETLNRRLKPFQSALPDDDSELPPPVTSRKRSRLSPLSSRLSRKGSDRSSNTSYESRRYRIGHRTGNDNPAQHVAKELLTVTLGGIIVILSVLAIALDPAEEENWFKRIEEGIFVMFSLGIPFLLAISSRLAEDLQILTPETEREVRSLRELRSMNKGMEYDEFVKELQKAILLDEELSALFSFENACYKLSRRPGKLVVPSHAVYGNTFKRVWFFGEDLAFNRMLGKAFPYRHENNVLYIDKEPVKIEGVVVHVRRRVGNYSLSSAPET